MYSYIPLDLNQLLDVGVDQWFQICIVNTHQTSDCIVLIAISLSDDNDDGENL